MNKTLLGLISIVGWVLLFIFSWKIGIALVLIMFAKQYSEDWL